MNSPVLLMTLELKYRALEVESSRGTDKTQNPSGSVKLSNHSRIYVKAKKQIHVALKRTTRLYNVFRTVSVSTSHAAL